MIDKTNIIETVMKRLKKLPTGHYLDLRPYKRNRSVIIVKNTEDNFLVIEDGYLKDKFCFTSEKLRKALKSLLRKEFPRSHKIRLYIMGRFTEGKIKNTERKIL